MKRPTQDAVTNLRALWPRRAPGLPPGQRRLSVFPRFGDDPGRPPPVVPERPEIQIVLGEEVIAVLGADSIGEQQFEQRADFHCVTTWSVTGLRWEGAQFQAVWQRLVAADRKTSDARFLKVCGLDHYAAVLTVEDALGGEVMIADRLDGQPLDARHGAPFRLVSPGQYGYKNVKHLSRIELHHDRPRSQLGAKEHLRARVAYEERHSLRSGRVLRWPYRLVVPMTATLAERTLRRSASMTPRQDRDVPQADPRVGRAGGGYGWWLILVAHR